MRPRRSWATLLTLVLSATLVFPPTTGAGEEGVTHCVVEAHGVRTNGELTLGTPRCHDTFAAAMADLSGGELQLPDSTRAADVFTDEVLAETLAQFTVGIHFEGFNGSGASITIDRASCSGTWNTGLTWSNRISSTFNGCARIRHIAQGASPEESTFGTGTTNNLSTLNNLATAVSYHSS